MEHVNIPDSQRHEPRGASTAASGQTIFSNGDGTTSFRFITPSDISGLGLNGYDLVLSSASISSTQNPTGLNTPLQVNFGPTASSTAASLSSSGTLTFNQEGEYLVTVFLRFGRTTGAGTATILNRLLLNDAQTLRTNVVSLTDSAAVIPFSASMLFRTSPGDTLKMEIARDGSGVNNGGLVSVTPSIMGWSASPTASILVYKLGG